MATNIGEAEAASHVVPAGGAAQMTRAGPAEEREEGASGVTGAKPVVSGAFLGGALRRLERRRELVKRLQ